MKFQAALARIEILELLKSAGRWWVGELLDLVPQAARRYFASRRALITIDIEHDSLAIAQVVSNRRRELMRATIADIAAHRLSDEVQGAIQKSIDAGAKPAIRLRPDEVLRKLIEFPLAAERDLRQILKLELDLHTPATIDDVSFDYRIAQRNVKTRRLTVELALVRREVVARALAIVAPLGLNLNASRVGVASGEGVQFNFTSIQRGRSHAIRPRRAAACLAALALVLLASATYLQEARKTTFDAELASELRKQKSLSDEARRLQQDIEGETHRYLFLPARRQAPLAATVLNELAHVLPDDTWLFQVELIGRQVRASGFSAASSQLIALIDQSTLFANAQFQSPLTQVSNQGLERFELSFDVKQGANP